MASVGQPQHSGHPVSPDSSVSSSTNPSFSSIGGTEPEFEGGDLGTNYRAPCVAEDDAGSSSHSEVRSSSPGLADADADVEDSPSGSEERESGSESERGGTPASVMYAPNIGFPPSRSSVTHTTIPTGANFVNTVKFAPGNNPFAVKGLPAGNISSSSSASTVGCSGGNSLASLEGCSSSRSNTSLANNSLTSRGTVSSGRWGQNVGSTSSGRLNEKFCSPVSWNSQASRPIIRPSALGSSLGSGVSSSTVGIPTSPPLNSFLIHQSNSSSNSMSSQPNYFAMAAANENNSEHSVVSSQQEGMGSSSSSSFVLRPPRLPNPFGLSSRTQISTSDFSTGAVTTPTTTDIDTPTSMVENKVDNEFAPSASGQGDVNTINADTNSTSGSNTTTEPSSTTQIETSHNQNLMFVPLEREERNSGFESVSTSCQRQTSVASGSAASSNLFSSLNGNGPGRSTTPNAVSNSSHGQPTEGGFVFGRNILERVQSSTFQPENEEHASTNGISSSDGLFCATSFAAIRNVQSSSSPNKLSSTSSAGDNSVNNNAASSSQNSSLSGAPTAFGDSSESHAYRKRRFDDAPVLTGEEDEMNVVQISCRLFAFDSDNSSWTERGRGQLRLNDRTESSNDLQSRLIVRTKGSLRLMLNTNVWADMKVVRSEKTVQFTANDNGHIRLFLIMATVNDTDQLYNALDWRVRTLKDQQQQLTSGGGSDDESSSLRKVDGGENEDGGAKRLVKSPDDTKVGSLGGDDDDSESLQDYHDSCEEEEVGEDADEEDDGELDDSPLKKKRFSGSSTTSNNRESGRFNSNMISPSAPIPLTVNPSENFHRPTPTIRINNQEINDFDHDECLD